MILTDIYIPSLGERMDFRLDEEAKIGSLVEEMAEMIAQREQWEMGEWAKGLQLFSMELERPLNREGTLGGYGVKDGSPLILI